MSEHKAAGALDALIHTRMTRCIEKAEEDIATILDTLHKTVPFFGIDVVIDVAELGGGDHEVAAVNISCGVRLPNRNIETTIVFGEYEWH